MRKKIKLIICAFLVLSLVCFFYTNSIMRVEYENNIDLPESTELVSVNSFWGGYQEILKMIEE